jgi:hypothetical protein
VGSILLLLLARWGHHSFCDVQEKLIFPVFFFAFSPSIRLFCFFRVLTIPDVGDNMQDRIWTRKGPPLLERF